MEVSQNILVVDDDPMIVELVADTLGTAGMRVVPCTNSLEALGILDRGGIDLVILDVMMPGSMASSFVAGCAGAHACR